LPCVPPRRAPLRDSAISRHVAANPEPPVLFEGERSDIVVDIVFGDQRAIEELLLRRRARLAGFDERVRFVDSLLRINSYRLQDRVLKLSSLDRRHGVGGPVEAAGPGAARRLRGRRLPCSEQARLLEQGERLAPVADLAEAELARVQAGQRGKGRVGHPGADRVLPAVAGRQYPLPLLAGQEGDERLGGGMMLARLEHGRAGNTHTDFVPDAVIDRFCLIGPVATHLERLRQFQELGVTQFAIYLQHDAKDATLAAYGEKIMPAIKARLAATNP